MIAAADHYGRGTGLGRELGKIVKEGTGVGVGVAVGVGVGAPSAAQYLPPVFDGKKTSLNPPHTIIWLPVHTAV